MNKKILVGLISVLFLSFVISACSPVSNKINMINARTAVGIDQNLKPIKVQDVFVKGTSQVFCWFQWNNAVVGTTVVARWHYLTDNIHILDYTFVIPRREGSGSISLTMPEGKILPAGLYKVE
ncbi:MAG: hypothetical protein NTY47_03845, partial [Candidatus Omnitrophica bacterium]|nr:hypothetical protein [Candidatus Omnitrophota bacterium]